MKKINCWEFKKCGRQPRGDKVKELGVCPAAICWDADGFCEGDNGAGRVFLFPGHCAAEQCRGHVMRKKTCVLTVNFISN